MTWLRALISRGRQRGWLNYFKRDACKFCHGHKGNTPGNENVLAGGVVACDDCSSLVNRIVQSARRWS